MELQAMLQFVYLGEATLQYESMLDFLKVAQDLQVREICETVGLNGELNTNNDVVDTVTAEYIEDMEQAENDPEPDLKVKAFYETVELKNGEPNTSDEGIENNDTAEYIEKRKEAKNDPEPRPIEENPRDKKFSKQMADDTKIGKCSQCGARYTAKQNLLLHIQSEHEGVRYHCTECPYKAKARNNLKAHIQTKHEGIRYPCEHCQLKATSKSNLRIHVRRHHSQF